MDLECIKIKLSRLSKEVLKDKLSKKQTALNAYIEEIITIFNEYIYGYYL